MDDEIRFKFNPLNTLSWSLFPIASIYFFVDMVNVKGVDNDGSRILLVFTVVLSWLFLPKFFKMIFGVPALILTQHQFIDNVSGLKIDWKDISGFRIKINNKSTFLFIKLSNHDPYIDNTASRRIFTYLASFDDDETFIDISYVKGEDVDILHQIENFKILYDRRVKNATISPPNKTAPGTAP